MVMTAFAPTGVAANIIDPTKVVLIAPMDATSVASFLITTEAVIAEKPKAPSGMGGLDF